MASTYLCTPSTWVYERCVRGERWFPKGVDRILRNIEPAYSLWKSPHQCVCRQPPRSSSKTAGAYEVPGSCTLSGRVNRSDNSGSRRAIRPLSSSMGWMETIVVDSFEWLTLNRQSSVCLQVHKSSTWKGQCSREHCTSGINSTMSLYAKHQHAQHSALRRMYSLATEVYWCVRDWNGAPPECCPLHLNNHVTGCATL